MDRLLTNRIIPPSATSSPAKIYRDVRGDHNLSTSVVRASDDEDEWSALMEILDHPLPTAAVHSEEDASVMTRLMKATPVVDNDETDWEEILDDIEEDTPSCIHSMRMSDLSDDQHLGPTGET